MERFARALPCRLVWWRAGSQVLREPPGGKARWAADAAPGAGSTPRPLLTATVSLRGTPQP